MTLARWSIIVLLVALMSLLACAQAPTTVSDEAQRKQADQLRSTVGSLFECAQAARAYVMRAERAEDALREARASGALCL